MVRSHIRLPFYAIAALVAIVVIVAGAASAGAYIIDGKVLSVTRHCNSTVTYGEVVGKTVIWFKHPRHSRKCWVTRVYDQHPAKPVPGPSVNPDWNNR